METWKKIFIQGFAPSMTARQLEALAHGLRTDDPKLMQGRTTEPLPLWRTTDWPCEGGCGIVYAFYASQIADGPEPTVGEAEEFFARCCYQCDELLGERAGCRWWLNWFDETPRPQMIALLLPVVEAVIAGRQPEAETDAANAQLAGEFAEAVEGFANCLLCGQPLDQQKGFHAACAQTEQMTADMIP